MDIIDDTDGNIEQDNNRPDLRETLFKYLRHWKWFVTSVIFFLILGYIYAKLSTPLYKIETDLLIKDNKNKMSGQSDLLKDLDIFSSGKIIDNEIQILKSKTILKKVVSALKLQTSYINTEGIPEKEVYEDKPFAVELLEPNSNAYKAILTIHLLNAAEVKVNGKKYAVKIPIKTEAGMILIEPTGKGLFSQTLSVKFNDMADILEQYGNNLKINPVSKEATSLIITLEDAIPQRGQDFLNRLVEEYNMAALEDKNKETSKTLTFITDRLDGIAADLSTVEKNVEQYKSTNRITDISAESKIFLQGVQDNDTELNKVLIQLSVLKNLENYLRKNDDQPSTLPSMLGIADPTLLGLVSQLGETQLKKLSLLQTVPETNPLVTTFTDQINSLKSAIQVSVQNLKKGLEITRQQLQGKNNQFESVIRKVPSIERGLLDVMRQQDIKNALFTYLLQKREETAMQLASGVADSRTIDPATSSKYPVKPIKNLIYFAFLIVGIVLPGGVIYFKALLNFRVNRKFDIERVTNIPVIAEISRSDGKDALLVVNKSRSIVAEQIRALRTNLQFVIPLENQKIILVTSSISGEGKSFVSLNLGASLAMSGKKVVILEMDLRKPKLNSGLGIDNIHGLSNYLIGKVNYKEILKPIALQENYYIITSGAIPPNPAELLVNGRVSKLIEELKQDFDYIILDTPPVGLVTDAQILGAYADLTLFIVRHNYTAKSQVNAIDKLYRTKKFNNMNIILNAIDMQSAYGYSYGYGYGYGYGGGYYQDDPEKQSFFKKSTKKTIT
ncbi:tyrosine-protein kinase family protein [uncultured Mucilaginibacter sp.]|uniref:GumC family protein n=1 Tax=uncultured Mucilaginibacter sp. TaxID=797541 RepID=UPI0025FC833F|nr:tyrosine-protein kinase family protein [uncultured Mucilaginibacter sp.]